MTVDPRIIVRDLRSAAPAARDWAAGLLREGRPCLDDGEGFQRAWEFIAAQLAGRPLLRRDDLCRLEQAGHVLLRFGEDLFPEEAASRTPKMRPSRPGDPPLNACFDYLLLMVARQVASLAPERVSGVQMMEQLYGGRLITDIIPEAGEHKDFRGAARSMDCTRQRQEAMHLHCDDADHLLRPPIQLICGVKNSGGTATTLAVLPSDEVLRSAGCEPAILRQPRFKHRPPGISPLELHEVPCRPVLFGPADRPRAQADSKGLVPMDEEARAAWEGLHAYLLRNQLEVVVRSGDVLVIDNYRGLHGRGVLEPVEHIDDRRWVKRLWLSPAAGELALDACRSLACGHPRVFDRSRVIRAGLDQPHPPLGPALCVGLLSSDTEKRDQHEHEAPFCGLIDPEKESQCTVPSLSRIASLGGS